jgi:hypothetical protein
VSLLEYSSIHSILCYYRYFHSTEEPGITEEIARGVVARASARCYASFIRRWKDGHHPVSGPAWVALEHLLRNHGETILADRVAEVVEQRRQR